MSEKSASILRAAPALVGAAAGAPPRPLWASPRVTGWAVVAAFLLAWEGAVAYGDVSPLYMPRPSRVVLVTFDMFAHGDLFADLVLTLGRIFLGFFVSLVFGVLVGVWMATSERFAAVADLFIAALYPLPKVTLIPLLIIWLGTGGPFMLTISFMGAVFPIIINTVVGVRDCDPGLVLAARDLRATRWQVVTKVLIPSAVPAIFAGIRIGLGVSIILVVAAEMVVGQAGLGGRLFVAGQLLETEQVFAILVVLAIVGILITKAQDVADARLGLWRTS